ncbi:hypothetical protein VdG2_07386 [Verticillium dahliae VDG2]|nr:hypothetical protein VdG2_07386 [Verticillium dahliae VDG2]
MASASAAAAFVPRLRFPLSESIPRSYYLGHHHAGLREITNRLSSIGLVLECRDYRLKAGGVPNVEAAADWAVKQWRAGQLGRFILDDVNDDAIRLKEMAREGRGPTSLSQARKREKEMRRERAINKQKAL